MFFFTPTTVIVSLCVSVCNICRGRCVDASLTQRGVRLTSCGGDVDVDADLGDASSLQSGHAGVRAEVGELEVYDVQVGGPRGDVRVRLGDDHPLRAPQPAPVLQPAERQLLWWGRLHLQHSLPDVYYTEMWPTLTTCVLFFGLYLTRYLDFTSNLDVVVVVVRVGSDPESSLFQSCGRKIDFVQARFTFVNNSSFSLQVFDTLQQQTLGPSLEVMAALVLLMSFLRSNPKDGVLWIF